VAGGVLLAVYAELRGSKGVGEGELEASLDKALVLFGYIQVCGDEWLSGVGGCLCSDEWQQGRW
jgi:hypothetical protein